MSKRRSTEAPPLARKQKALCISQSRSDGRTNGPLTPESSSMSPTPPASPTNTGHDESEKLSHTTIARTSLESPKLTSDSAQPVHRELALSRDLREVSYDGTVILPDAPERDQQTWSTTLTPYMPGNSFPIFHNGEVIIEIHGGNSVKTFQLHAEVLAAYSSYFLESFQKSKRDGLQPTRFSYIHEGSQGDAQLRRQSTPSKPTYQNNSVSDVLIKTEPLEDNVGPLNTPNGDDATIANYTKLLGMFYRIAPEIPTKSVNMALLHCERLLRLGAHLECLPLIRLYLGNIFPPFRQELYVAIKSDPARWLALATSLQDSSIYTEALIHLIGAHPSWPWPTERTTLPPEAHTLIAQKSTALDLACLQANQNLFFATIEISQGRNANPRPVPCEPGTMRTWHTIQIFRDTLSNALREVDSSNLSSLKRGALYRKIHKGGSAYLSFEETRATCLNIFKSGWEELGSDLDSLKQFASAVVDDLAANELMIDPDAHGVGYLTCSKIGREDVPW